MPRQSFAQLASGWARLLGGLKKEPSEPLLEDLRLTLETALAEVFQRHREMLELRAMTLTTARLQREATARGKAAETRLRALMRVRYGDTSKLLHRFGMRPRGPSRRRALKRRPERTQTGETEAPAAPATVATGGETAGRRRTAAPKTRRKAAPRSAAGARRPRHARPARAGKGKRSPAGKKAQRKR